MRKMDSVRYTLLVASMLMGSVAWSHVYTSASDLELSAQSISSASAGRDIQLNNVSVEGSLSAGRNVACQGCTVSGNIQAGRDILLEQCHEVHRVTGGHNVELNTSHVLEDITSGRNINLHAVQADRDLHAGYEVRMDSSTVEGMLSLGGHYLRLNRSTAGEVRFVENLGNVSGGHGGTFISIGHMPGNMVGMAAVQQNSSGTFVRVGSRGLSSFNGYTIQGAGPGSGEGSPRTTVITPDQTIYVNGLKVAGTGPKLYADYRVAHPEAPHVDGPGWRSDEAPTKRTASGKEAAAQTPVNILELTDHSVLHGSVNFESGYGKIRVYPGSEFKGKVINGVVEHVSATAQAQ